MTAKNVTPASDFIFIYDAKNCNPNGDPNEDNMPRTIGDRINLVSDVRLKRFVRDYWDKFKNKLIFYKQTLNEENFVKPCKERAKDFEGLNEIMSLIDIKCFGGAITLGKKQKPSKEDKAKQKLQEEENGEKAKAVDTNYQITGAINLMHGESLNFVDIQFMKGTGAFASDEGKTQKTFREEHFVKYSLIGFCGAVNSNVAATNNLTTDELVEFKEALWNGVRAVTSRSKYGQNPRLFLNVVYKSQTTLGNFYGLYELENKEISSFSEATIDFKKLTMLLNKNKDMIDYIEIKKDMFVNMKNFDLDKSIKIKEL